MVVVETKSQIIEMEAHEGTTGNHGSPTHSLNGIEF